MSNSLIECIPNFSEGRRLEVVEAIVGAIKAVSGTTVLDYSLDSDHNRSVVTFVGNTEAVEEAAFQAVAKAASLIDLEQHEGAHPRIGATDVFPFVPISGVSMADCVAISKRVGKRIAEELGIPVYLYEESASSQERENLANHRKGEYEGLKKLITSDPTRKPDFGPHQLGKAGATVVGARSPLVAYNVFLNTEDVEIAKQIAKAVRHLSGGLRYVKGLGMLVDGQAQVSMNLTNFKKTPVFRVVEMIRREAARYGVQITHSELIGLIPQQAIDDAATWYLQLDDFDSDQILENKIRAAQTEETARQHKAEFIEALAAASPTPGGGSAAAYNAAMGAALVAMVAQLSMGKKKFAEIEAEMQAVLHEAEVLRKALLKAVDKDAEAFEAVMSAYQLPRSTEAEQNVRKATIYSATLTAAEVPMEVAQMAFKIMALAVKVVDVGNLNAISDGASGFASANAGFTSASLNVKINLTALDNEPRGDILLRELREMQIQIEEFEARIHSSLKTRAEIE